MHKNTLIAIDQSYTSSGVAIFDIATKSLVKILTIVTKPNKEDPLDMFKRAETISSIIIDLCETYNCTALSIEGLAMGRVIGNSNRDLAILQGIIINKVMEVVDENRIVIVSPTAVKKHATGKGNSKKEEMFEHLPDDVKSKVEKYLKTKGRYDVTDAYFIGTYHLQTLIN